MSRDDVCEINTVHEKNVSYVRSKMLNQATFRKLAGIFSLLGDPTRTKLLYALSQKELCVCDLSAVLGLSQSAVSHQLRLLRTANLVRNRKQGRIVYYTLADDHVTTLIGIGLEHANEPK